MRLLLPLLLLACGPKRPLGGAGPPAVALPEARVDALAAPPLVVLVVAREGAVWLEGIAQPGVLRGAHDGVSAPWLADALHEAHQRAPEAKLVVAADARADFSLLRQVIFAATAAGFAQTVYATAPEPGDPSGSWRGLLVDVSTFPLRDPLATLGSLDQAHIDQVIGADRAAIQRCYDAARVRQPALHGRIVVKFVLSREGSVQQAGIRVNEMNEVDPALEACLLGRVSAMAFPRPSGGIVIVSYPFEFAPG